MKFITILLYFIFAIMFLAAIGVLIPLTLDIMYNDQNLVKNLNQNLITYFIAIAVTSSLDYIMKIIDNQVTYRKPVILITCILNTIVLFMACQVMYYNVKGKYLQNIPWQIFVGIIFSFTAWWLVNYNNSNFDPTSSLGGDTSKPLSNGK
ncbi:hypothetical protein NK356_02030 [Chryseobacterium sp. S0630]|uniref:hypothetical protein n=1 Tax=Chryseobacterium sp. S0630 TaxID=2957803 RepID=UPI00209FCB07|nr:hypothetical protein [Chryseobacterium sp. S0630]MCP1297952.1 hypothetical protein [Chryseobacterium sp. S0630]